METDNATSEYDASVQTVEDDSGQQGQENADDDLLDGTPVPDGVPSDEEVLDHSDNDNVGVNDTIPLILSSFLSYVEKHIFTSKSSFLYLIFAGLIKYINQLERIKSVCNKLLLTKSSFSHSCTKCAITNNFYPNMSIKLKDLLIYYFLYCLTASRYKSSKIYISKPLYYRDEANYLQRYHESQIPDKNCEAMDPKEPQTQNPSSHKGVQSVDEGEMELQANHSPEAPYVRCPEPKPSRTHKSINQIITLFLISPVHSESSNFRFTFQPPTPYLCPVQSSTSVQKIGR